jgi:hypothetical protein
LQPTSPTATLRQRLKVPDAVRGCGADYYRIASSRLARSAGSALATSNATAANRKAAEDRPRNQEHLVAQRDLRRAPQVLLHHRPKGANASKSQNTPGCRAREGVAIFEVDQC